MSEICDAAAGGGSFDLRGATSFASFPTDRSFEIGFEGFYENETGHASFAFESANVQCFCASRFAWTIPQVSADAGR